MGKFWQEYFMVNRIKGLWKIQVHANNEFTIFQAFYQLIGKNH